MLNTSVISSESKKEQISENSPQKCLWRSFSRWPCW